MSKEDGIKNDPMTTVTSGAPVIFFRDGCARKPTVTELLERQSIDPEKYKLPEKSNRSVAVTMLGNSFPALMKEVLGHKKK